MNHDQRPEPLAPPHLAREKVVELVSYAEHVVLMLQWEGRELRRLNRDSADLLPVIQGWEFMSLALRESYDLDETDFPR
jgi:hypothetical protein